VVQEAPLNPDSDPERGFGYPSLPNGKHHLISRADGSVTTLQLDPGSRVMHVDRTQVIVKEHGQERHQLKPQPS